MAQCFDEMTLANGATRAVYSKIARWLAETPTELLASRRAQAELLFRRIGITFAVYGDKDSTERLIPFDIIPRVLSRSEWTRLEKGLVLRAKAMPDDIVFSNPHFRPEMSGWRVPHDIYVHIAGIDIVRIDETDFYVL